MPGRAATRKCRFDGCDQKAVVGLWLCDQHLTARTQCTKIIRRLLEDGSTIEQRCSKVARQGTILCGHHSSKRSVEIQNATRAVLGMRTLAKPFEGDLNPLTAFEGEFRRTYGRILWLEDQIQQLSAEELIWGKTKQEEICATEFSGTNTTYESRVHQWELMLRWERQHFLDLEKLWITAKLDQAKLNMMRDHIAYTYSKAIELARMLGFDPNSDSTREILMRLFASDQNDPKGDHSGDDRRRSIPTAR